MLSSKERSSDFLHDPQRFITPTPALAAVGVGAGRDLQEAHSVIETTKLGCLERPFFSVPTLVIPGGRSKCPHHPRTHRYSDLSSRRKGQPRSTCQPCELELSMTGRWFCSAQWKHFFIHSSHLKACFFAIIKDLQVQ